MQLVVVVVRMAGGGDSFPIKSADTICRRQSLASEAGILLHGSPARQGVVMVVLKNRRNMMVVLYEQEKHQ